MTDPRTSLIRQQLAELGRRHAAAANAGAVTPRPARVLVIGNFGNGNTGDEAMLARTLQELPEGREVKVVSRNPRMVEALHHVPAVPMEGVAFVKALHWCDGNRNLEEVIRLTELEMGPQTFDFVGYFKFLQKHGFVEFI